ncbi:MAG: ATP-binding protein [Chloroflexi bacterium]|nr:ATP-binding protein [Chloroflexota bacterium]
MINKPFDAIEKSDIDFLVTEKVAEQRTIEYKSNLLIGPDKDKKEFLADVSSFANASGGDILYGVEEEKDSTGKGTGRPEVALGLTNINIDALKLTLHNLIRDGIDPRIPVVQIKAIEGFPNGHVVLIRISKSWSPPHMVKLGGSSRFYSRVSSGKYQLDATEIRAAFVLSEALPERIKSFRIERLAKIIADETPVPILPLPKLVLHVLPLSAFTQSFQVDLQQVALDPPFPLFVNNLDNRYNLDGFLTFRRDRESAVCDAYLQVFRSGAMEAVDTIFLTWRQNNTVIFPLELSQELINSATLYLKHMKQWEIHPPVVIMLTLLGVKDRIIKGNEFRPYQIHSIDRNDLLLPEIVVEDFDAHVPTVLRPIFDSLWQSAGWARSMNYTRDGKWQGER